MPGPPPPPLPPPQVLGFGSSGPPPPPPPPPGGLLNPRTLSDRSPSTVAKGRGALLTDITKGTRLKKAVTNDRSAPIVGEQTSNSVRPSLGIAPTVPIGGRPPRALAPPVSREAGPNRARSNSDGGGSGQVDEYTNVSAAPQLGGIFAGIGIPKLRKTGGVIDTGRDSSYDSEPETLRFSAPKPPTSSTSKLLAAPKSSALRPSPQTTESSPPHQPSNHLLVNLRKPPLRPVQRPISEINPQSKNLPSDTTPPRAPPPSGISKPAPPLIASRKPSTVTPPVPRFSTNIPTVAPPPPSGVPPRPPLSFTSTSPNIAPPTPAPRQHPPVAIPTMAAASQRPSISAPRTPPSRSTSPPPAFSDNNNSLNETATPSLAMQAARNAYGSRQASPALPPPPPPAPPLSFSLAAKQLIQPNPLSASPSPPVLRPNTQQPNRSMLDPSSYTLSNGNVGHNATHLNMEDEAFSNCGILKIEDGRWRFQDESQLPKPREFVGASKLYRAGRGSSVPLDLTLFR